MLLFAGLTRTFARRTCLVDKQDIFRLSQRQLSVQGYPGGGDLAGSAKHPDVYPPGGGDREPSTPKHPDLYPEPISDVDKQPDVDEVQRDAHPDVIPPRFPSPEENIADFPNVHEPPTPGSAGAGAPGGI